MTCVWDSLIAGIPLEKKSMVTGKKNNPNKKQNNKQKSHRKDTELKSFLKYIQQNTKKTNNVSVNDSYLTSKQIDENFRSIQSLCNSDIYNGYLCSTCDPFLILFCELFECSIFHIYINSKIRYNHVNSKFIVYLHSSETHMTHRRTVPIDNPSHFLQLTERFIKSIKCD